MTLITAFEPFDNRPTNQSEEILEKLSQHYSKIVLPVSVREATKALDEINLESYDWIMMLGEANREFVTAEKYAYNELNMRIPDNRNIQIKNAVIIEDGITLKTSLALESILKPEEISVDPGRYLCNYVYYKVLLRNPNTLFIHVPIMESEHTLTKVEEIINAIEKDSNFR